MEIKEQMRMLTRYRSDCYLWQPTRQKLVQNWFKGEALSVILEPEGFFGTRLGVAQAGIASEILGLSRGELRAPRCRSM